MKNKMSDLRNHLFATLEDLRDEDNPMDLARAKAVQEVAQAIINSAKVEVDLIKATDGALVVGDFFEGIDAAELPRHRQPKLVGRG